MDRGSGKVYQTKCWHKLVVVKDPKSGSMGCFIAFFIPDRAYALSHGGDIGRVLTNGEEMGSYSPYAPFGEDTRQGVAPAFASEDAREPRRGRLG